MASAFASKDAIRALRTPAASEVQVSIKLMLSLLKPSTGWRTLFPRQSPPYQRSRRDQLQQAPTTRSNLRS